MEDTTPLIDSSSFEEDAPKQRKSRNILKKLLPEELKKYWKTIFLAGFLFISGLSFLVIALYIISLPDEINGPHSYVFILCGVICIVPGGYHVVYIYFALRGREDYRLEELLTFGEE